MAGREERGSRQAETWTRCDVGEARVAGEGRMRQGSMMALLKEVEAGDERAGALECARDTQILWLGEEMVGSNAAAFQPRSG